MSQYGRFTKHGTLYQIVDATIYVVMNVTPVTPARVEAALLEYGRAKAKDDNWGTGIPAQSLWSGDRQHDGQPYLKRAFETMDDAMDALKLYGLVTTHVIVPTPCIRIFEVQAAGSSGQTSGDANGK